MAKRRARKTSRSRSFGGVGVWGSILGVGGYILYEVWLRPMIPIHGAVLSIAEIALGIWLSRKGGMLGNVGKAAVILNVYGLLSGYVKPMLSGGISTSAISY